MKPIMKIKQDDNEVNSIAYLPDNNSQLEGKITQTKSRY